MLHRFLLFFCIAQGLIPAVLAQEETDSRIVQINGVTITADSLRAVPFATVTVKNKYRGVSSSELGVFSLVCYKGDTLEFTAVGFRAKTYVVPKHIRGQYFSMIQLMVQDTFYLPETIVRALPTREQFDYAFTHWQIPDDQYEIARKNTDALMLRAMAYTMPRDGRENQAVYQQGMAREAIYYGQVRPSNITNPISWAEFFESWKRGDFRRKNY
jgi:hypothetical protein